MKRPGLVSGTGTPGACDGSFCLDFNAFLAAHPAKKPGAGAIVQAQLWFRDPLNTSNQTTGVFGCDRVRDRTLSTGGHRLPSALAGTLTLLRMGSREARAPYSRGGFNRS